MGLEPPSSPSPINLRSSQDDGDRTVREETTTDIIRRCAEFVPELLSAPIIAEYVCIRPGRKEGVRLERETVEGGFHIIHNYGHGGAGMSLAWGCATDVLNLVEEAFKPQNRSRM
jgi:D-amino-acid oxidase